MEIREAIVHHLAKERNAASSLCLRSGCLELTEPVTRLITDLHRLYNTKAGKMFGIFHKDTETYPFSRHASSYISEETPFLEFTEQAMRLAQLQIDQKNFATGGYFLFSRYIVDGHDYLGVVMLNETLGASVDQATLSVSEAAHLDLDKLHLAASVNLTQWQDGKLGQRYVSFARSRASEGIAGYFADFIGCDETADSRTETATLVSTVNNFCRAKELEAEPAATLKQKVFEYCQERITAGKPVYISELSRVINEEEPEAFAAYAASDDVQLSNVLHPDRTSLRKLQRISLRGSGMSLTFDASLLNRSVFYQDGRLTFTELPENIRQQLENT